MKPRSDDLEHRLDPTPVRLRSSVSATSRPLAEAWSRLERRPRGATGSGSDAAGPMWWTAAMTDKLEITRDIAAPPEAVYAAISDVTRMGEWSEECHTCEWHDGFDGPVVGATFDGHNRNGDKEWTTQGTVVEAEPGRAFTFECSMMDFHFSTWGYRIEPTDTGSRVTEWSVDLRPESALEFSKKMSGVDDRVARNEATMSATLERLAAHLES